MSINPQQIVLLAAGMGTRLGDLGGGLPKAMFDAGGTFLLDRALDFAELLGATERIVVGGFRHDLVAAHLATQTRPALRLVENTQYRIGNLMTLETALPLVTGGFLLMNIDHVYPSAVADRIRAQSGDTITAFVDFDRPLGDDDMKVQLIVDTQADPTASPGSVRRRISQISKKLATWSCGYVGMTFVPASKLERYRQAVAAVRAGVGDPANVEQVLQHLADAGEPVGIGDISGIGWHELDTPEDVAKALPALERLR
ncbi:MAG: NTP transferase domain-containing protein [Deltaproteobacteria bacterium]|nr:NTP transferase domain-containing protein [Deltaproteobacteria bacterium]